MKFLWEQCMVRSFDLFENGSILMHCGTLMMI